MKFATAKEHRDFFQKYGWIEFEGLLSNDQLALANQAIDQVLAERLHLPPERLKTASSENFYLQGHDLWRSHSFLHKFVTQVHFAEIAAELIEKKPLRLGYDQLFPARSQTAFMQETPLAYPRFLEQTASLETVSCLQGVACGFLLALGIEETSSSTKEVSFEGPDIFPNQPGSIIFFQPHLAVNWSHLYAHRGQRFYLIVYTFASAHYQLNPQDPHTHALKRLGYVFNDKLNDKLHPIVYR
jgi:hypothetical protein